MIAPIVGSIVSSAYQNTSIRGYSLPLISNSSKYTRYTIIISSLEKMLKSKKPLSLLVIKDDLKRNIKNESFKDEFSEILTPLDLIILFSYLKLCNQDFKLESFIDLENSISKLGIINSINLINSIFHYYSLGIEYGQIFTSFKEELVFNDIDIKKERLYLEMDDYEKGIMISLNIISISDSYEDSIRWSLYIGGNTSLTILMTSIFNELRGVLPKKDLLFFSKNHLNKECPQIYNLFF